MIFSNKKGDPIMTIKTVLSVLGVNHFDADLKGAIDFCETRGAHLTAMVISMGAAPPIGSAEIVSTVWIEERQREVDSLADKASEIKAILARSEASSEVQEIYTEFAWADEDIAERALYADLVLIGPQAAGDRELRRRVIDGALFRSPTPMLINPKKTNIGFAPKSILLAWDSSDEASRAARQSIEFLQAAESVHVTLVDPRASSSANGEEPGADVATFLARHGIEVDVDCVASGGRRVDEVLRQHSVDVAADMIVMGAYNHSRLQQRLFGGVTRSMVEETKVPLFLAH
ncbi:universal stress protein (plasmid) [Rhizobium leguminosarum]|uniref:universal stress protein n=1 Tax=Rhizobium TaxID=379 RepID=UPI001031F0AA|nr:universal stress protein [Rhizobium leguminosarum]WSH10675.1 universal stress protein [Rhizobium johnstonii]TBF24533.1 universal stress protein [Rhizobium leguminosarum]TBF44952.1 universal stress protein [Rhizobium leguminosarum]TBF45158.1 universal stress protein [Rhizobium leguminosarum]TBF45915.1 universal stress protein [Rhizobium leguminosarum]